MMYREQIEAARDRLRYVAAYLRAVEELQPKASFYMRNDRHAKPDRLPKPYERLEQQASLLERVAGFYPTRDQMRASAQTFWRDPVSGAYYAPR